MGFSRTGILLIGVLAMALGGCEKVSGSWTSSGGSSSQPSAAPQQALAAVPASAAAAAPDTLDFGDDNGKYSRDGECDDPRFSGTGMTNTPLLDSDIKHDATDCRTAFSQGRLAFKETAPSPEPARYDSNSAVGRIMWGDDNGKYARDGECDDKRFAGAGMTDTPLLDSDIKHDATDCRSAFSQGRLTLRE